MNNSIPPGSSRLGVSKVIEGIVYVFAKEHREKAKKVSAAIVPIEDEVIPKSITKRTNKKHYKLV